VRLPTFTVGSRTISDTELPRLQHLKHGQTMRNANPGSLDWLITCEGPYSIFVPTSSAARQWAIDCMPEAVASDELGRYCVPDHMSAEIHRKLQSERFALVNLGIGSSSNMA
jgi:hypothetical protein